MASPRITEPEEVAALVTFIVSDAARQHHRIRHRDRRRHHQDVLAVAASAGERLGLKCLGVPFDTSAARSVQPAVVCARLDRTSLCFWCFGPRLDIMQGSTIARAERSKADELLTTGEAARLLSSSRQHVVDLCDRGDLPFSTTGVHRRVRRSDVEALRTRTDRLTRDQTRSLWLAYAVAGAIVQDPLTTIGVAKQNLQRLQAQHTRGRLARWLGEWEALLDGPVEEVLATLTSRTPRARELRQNTPFAGVLPDDQRVRVLQEHSAAHASRP